MIHVIPLVKEIGIILSLLVYLFLKGCHSRHNVCLLIDEGKSNQFEYKGDLRGGLSW